MKPASSLSLAVMLPLFACGSTAEPAQTTPPASTQAAAVVPERDAPPELAPLWQRPVAATPGSLVAAGVVRLAASGPIECGSCGDARLGDCTRRARFCTQVSACPAPGIAECEKCDWANDRFPELCDGTAFDEGLSCTSLGYAGGALTCSPDCLAYDETSCDPCTRSGLVDRCATTAAETSVGVRLAVAARRDEVALAAVHYRAEPSGCALEVWRFDPKTLHPRGAPVCIARAEIAAADITTAQSGAWWVLATRHHPRGSTIYQLEGGRVREVARLAGHARGFARRYAAGDPLALAWDDTSATHLSTIDDAGVVATTELAASPESRAEIAVTAMPGGFAVIRQRAHRDVAEVLFYDTALGSVGSRRALPATGETPAVAKDVVWDGSRLVAVLQVGHRDVMLPLSATGEAAGAPWSAQASLYVASLARGLGAVAIGSRSDPTRPSGLFLTRPFSPHVRFEHIATTTRPTLPAIAALGANDAIVAWTVPGSRRVRLARVRF